ncbi:MAG TPA: TRAM domain-containing protein, partial [Planctomycetota bacterium]|nr:TRAM domain-containing protein [Planctomycetota bacterium]
LTLARNRTLVGSTAEVLVEGDSKVHGRLSGRTAQHRLVHFAASDRELFGQYVPVRITEALAHSVLGELLAPDEAETSAHDPVEAARP